MRLTTRLAVAGLVWAFCATSLAAQDRALIVSIYGGGADHLADLRSSPPVWFLPGWNLGASAGVQINRYFGLHGDFTFTRNPTRGQSTFAGMPTFAGNEVNRFYYGAHLEGRYPFSNGLAPFLFAGLGAVSVDQSGTDAFAPFTRPAAMYGGGLFYAIPQTRLEVFGEVKGLTYRWNTAGFRRTMVDVTYSGGLSYRLPF